MRPWICLLILPRHRKTTPRLIHFRCICVVYISSLKQTGNEKDVTMQAGKQRGALPLIRRFNQHSERLLNSALYYLLFYMRCTALTFDLGGTFHPLNGDVSTLVWILLR
jgi:hypothetical protein